jgi:hypothetical protein
LRNLVENVNKTKVPDIIIINNEKDVSTLLGKNIFHFTFRIMQHHKQLLKFQHDEVYNQLILISISNFNRKKKRKYAYKGYRSNSWREKKSKQRQKNPLQHTPCVAESPGAGLPLAEACLPSDFKGKSLPSRSA